VNSKIPIYICLMGILTISLSFHSFAVEGQSLTLDQALPMALEYDSQVATARNNVAKSKLAVEQTVLKTYPQASVVDYQTHDLNGNNSTNTLILTIQETYPTNFNLYGNKVPSDIEAAFWDQVTGEATLRITEANVRYNTISLYIAALEAQKNLEYQERVLKDAESALKLAELQMKQAKITRPDELQAENTVTNARFNLTKYRSDYRLALLQLGNQIGITDPETIQLTEVNPPVENFDPVKLKEESLPKRMELQQAQISIRQAERTVAQSKNLILPELNLTYYKSDSSSGYGYGIGYNFLSGDITGNVEDRTNSDTSYYKSSNSNSLFNKDRNNIQMTLTWNLDFGINKKQIRQDEIALENAKKSLEQVRQNAGWEIDQAIANYRVASQKVAANQQLLPYYQKQLELKKLAEQLGSATRQDVNDAEQALLQAKLQVDLATYDYILTYQKLKLVTGNLY
jgi:outer membrane protein TolC